MGVLLLILIASGAIGRTIVYAQLNNIGSRPSLEQEVIDDLKKNLENPNLDEETRKSLQRKLEPFSNTHCWNRWSEWTLWNPHRFRIAESNGCKRITACPNQQKGPGLLLWYPWPQVCPIVRWSGSNHNTRWLDANTSSPYSNPASLSCALVRKVILPLIISPFTLHSPYMWHLYFW